MHKLVACGIINDFAHTWYLDKLAIQQVNLNRLIFRLDEFVHTGKKASLIIARPPSLHDVMSQNELKHRKKKFMQGYIDRVRLKYHL